MNDERFSYDSVPYPSFTFPQTRPERLSTLGLFHGIETALPDDCRMLELGCGDGTNLNSFAYCHPKSKFVGIDLSSVHIDDANQAKRALALDNIEFICADVSKLSVTELGKFDFIIAHGLFSWVPAFVRDHILRLYSECLADNGIGYISYNAYPGFHLREVARGIMRFHTRSITDPVQKVEQAKNILGFVRQAMPADHLHARLIERELKEVFERTSSNVFHDDLSENNQAFYLHEFVNMIESHRLQYVGDTDNSSVKAFGMSSEVKETLAAIAPDHIEREQYLDMIKFRRFRSSVICKEHNQLTTEPELDILSKLRVSTPLKASSTPHDLLDTSSVIFVGQKDESVEVNHPLTKSSIDLLGAMWTHSLDFDTVMKKASETLQKAGIETTEHDVKRLAKFFTQMYEVGLVNFHRFVPNIADNISDHPKTSAFARWQISKGCDHVTTLTGMNLELESDLVRLLILLSDGTKSISEIESEVLGSVEVPEKEREAFNASLPEMIALGLIELQKTGLLEN